MKPYAPDRFCAATVWRQIRGEMSTDVVSWGSSRYWFYRCGGKASFELFSTQPYAFEERDIEGLKRMGLLIEKALNGEFKWRERHPLPNNASLYPVKKKRRFPRFDIAVPVCVNALRSGVPDTIPGRCKNMGQGGLAAVLTEELSPGDVVVVEFSLPLVSAAIKLRAQVRSQERLHHGFEFLIPRLEGPERAC